MFSELILEDVELKKRFNARSLILLSFEEYICILPPLPKTFFPLTCPNNYLISRHAYIPLYCMTHAKKNSRFSVTLGKEVPSNRHKTVRVSCTSKKQGHGTFNLKRWSNLKDNGNSQTKVRKAWGYCLHVFRVSIEYRIPWWSSFWAKLSLWGELK